MIVIPDNAYVNSSIFCGTDIEIVNVRYSLESYLATLTVLLYCIVQYCCGVCVPCSVCFPNFVFIYLQRFNCC